MTKMGVGWVISSLFVNMTLASKQTMRWIADFTTSARRQSSVKSISATKRRSQVEYGRIELNSHANTIVFGQNCLVLSYTGRECNVSPYTDTYQAIKSIPIAKAATAWTSKTTGETYILVFNKGLWMGDHMQNTLINPNQLRHYGIKVQDNPFDDSPLYVMSEDGDFAMQLELHGTSIVAKTRTPTEKELHECQHIVLSAPHPWEPHSISFPTSSKTLQDVIDIHQSVGSVHTILHDDVEKDRGDIIYDLNGMINAMIGSVRVQAEPSRPKKVAATSTDAEAPDLFDIPELRTFESKERHTLVTPQDLSERWYIGLGQAASTLKKTTQRMVRSAIMPLARRYKADRMYEQPRLSGEWFTDTMDGRVISKDGNRYAQVFANKGYFVHAYPMDSKKKAGDALCTFCQEFGIPDRLTFDGSKEQNGKNTEFMKQIRKNNITLHTIEPERHNQNSAEGVIREVRRKWFRTMVRKRIPKRFWDYGIKWVCKILQRTSTQARRLEGKTPIETVTGETPDISEYLDFGLYDWVWYHDNAGLGERLIGRWLGVSHHIGSLMSYFILTKKCTIISRTTVQRVTNLETQVEEYKQIFKEFDLSIADKLKSNLVDGEGDKPDPQDWAEFSEFDADFIEEFNSVVNNKSVPEADQDFTPEILDDTYLNMEVALPQDGEGPEFACVTKRLRDANGIPIGTANDNPIMDTQLYEVKYADGHKTSLAANVIAQNLFAQVDEEGNRHVLFDEIIDHRTNGKEVKQQNAFITRKTGNKKRRQTTQG